MARTNSTLPLVVFAVLAYGVAVGGQATPWQPPDATGAGQTPIMPVHQEPHHRQVFQRGPMRILDLQVPPGDVSWFHTHEWPVYYLTTSDSPTVTNTRLITYETGSPGEAMFADFAMPMDAPAPEEKRAQKKPRRPEARTTDFGRSYRFTPTIGAANSYTMNYDLESKRKSRFSFSDKAIVDLDLMDMVL